MARKKSNSTKCDYCIAHFKEESAVPELIEMLQNDPRPVIRGTIAWALGEMARRRLYGDRGSIVEEADQKCVVN